MGLHCGVCPAGRPCLVCQVVCLALGDRACIHPHVELDVFIGFKPAAWQSDCMVYVPLKGAALNARQSARQWLVTGPACL